MASGPNKKPSWAWVDSGAQSSLATIETGILFAPIRPASPIVCHYAGGQEVPTNIAVDIGPEEFHLVKGLEDNLFSVEAHRRRLRYDCRYLWWKFVQARN